MADKSFSDFGNDLNLRVPGGISQYKSTLEDLPATPDHLCLKCNGEGYIVIRVYPWDGCSYDEKLCDLCNPRQEASADDEETLYMHDVHP